MVVESFGESGIYLASVSGSYYHSGDRVVGIWFGRTYLDVYALFVILVCKHIARQSYGPFCLGEMV